MAKRRKPRHKKGDVVVWARNKMLRLRWRYGGKQQHLALGLPDTPFNREQADRIAIQIQRDIVHGDYDPTLERYRLRQENTPSSAPTTAQLFEQFMESRRRDGTSGQTIATKYKSLLGNLSRFGDDVESVDDACRLVDLLRGRQSARVANQNLTLLRTFGDWLVIHGHLTDNVFQTIQLAKVSFTNRREPFTVEEVNRFLATVKTDPTRYRFHDFCMVLFHLGLRPSEAIGLRWQHVDLQAKQVTICESLSRSSDGRSAGYARQRKSTKTGSVRVLRLSEKMLSLFAGRWYLGAQPDGLIFTSATGKPICDRNFRERCWKPICKKAGIPYRPPYVARHTCLSHGIEYKGWTLPQAAKVAGHSNTRTIAETYAHAVELPEMPDF